MLKLYNTLTRQVEEFTPFNPPQVGMYSCGPTVYDYAHIGNLSKYVRDDVLDRLIRINGYKLKHVMNITDVGHLVSDEDSGEDKIEKGAREQGRTVWEAAKFFEEYFFKATDKLNIQRPEIVTRATEHITEQIKLIQKLVKKGLTYQTDQAIYFDISKFPEYTKLSGQKLDEKAVGVRAKVVVDQQKKHPADFVLWFFTVGHFEDHTMRWPSPWGEGFPGWHIECSAMSMAYLGSSFDIHTGGIDHISVHHTNEIAQSEAATGQPFVKYWVHYDMILVNGGKMSKSKKNFYTLEDLKARGLDPLAFRYLILTAHYKDKLNFTWESLQAAQNTLNNIREQIRAWEEPKGEPGKNWQKFLESANNDIGIPQAVAVLHNMIHNGESNFQKSRDLLEMDKVLGLGLDQYLAQPLNIPEEVQKLVERREKVRTGKNFEQSDRLRHEIKKLGFDIEDTPTGPKVKTLKVQ